MHTYKQQAGLLVALVTIYALVAFVYMLLPDNAAVLAALPGVTAPGLAAANAGTVLATYLPLGLLGLWLARRLGLPGIIHPDPEIRPALWRPLLLGIGLGAMMVIVDLVTKDLGISPGSSHPPFPASILASISAGIGEEIVFRLFVMSLWAIVLNWLLGRLFRGRDTRGPALWSANILAALAFAAAHLGTLTALYGGASLAALPPAVVALTAVLNILIAIPAGEQFRRQGLVAAGAVHLGADLVWHVAYGLVAATLLIAA